MWGNRVGAESIASATCLGLASSAGRYRYSGIVNGDPASSGDGREESEEKEEPLDVGICREGPDEGRRHGPFLERGDESRSSVSPECEPGEQLPPPDLPANQGPPGDVEEPAKLRQAHGCGPLTH